MYAEKRFEDIEQELLTPVQRILLDAANELETNGWCQYALKWCAMGEPDRHCVIGSIRKVLGIEQLMNASPEAYCLLENTLDKVKHTIGCECLASWNDTRDRTKEQVIDALRKAAGQEINRDLGPPQGPVVYPYLSVLANLNEQGVKLTNTKALEPV